MLACAMLLAFCLAVAGAGSPSVVPAYPPPPPSAYWTVSLGPPGGLCRTQSYQLQEVNKAASPQLACAIESANSTLMDTLVHAPLGDLLLHGAWSTNVDFPTLTVDAIWQAPAVDVAWQPVNSTVHPPALQYYSLRNGVADATCSFTKRSFQLNVPLAKYSLNFSSLVVAPQTSQLDWLAYLLLHGKALALGYPSELVPGTAQCTGALNFTAVRVFIQIPVPHFKCFQDLATACPPPPKGQPSAALVRTFTRDDRRCVNFHGCVLPHPCPMYILDCPPGYQLTTIANAWPSGCPQFFCDPIFSLPAP